MAGAQRLTLVISVAGYGEELSEKEFDVQIRMMAPTKSRIQNWMRNKVQERVRAGLDVDGQPFKAKKDGNPATLIESGAMINGIKSARGADLRDATKTKTLAAVGITCVPGGDFEARYPWFLHNGVDPDHIREREGNKIKRKLQRKQERLQRKTTQAAETAETTKKWLYLMETAKGINQDITDLQKQLNEVNSAQFHTLPARHWWGLQASEREKVETAMKDWFWMMIEGTIAAACNPEENPPDKVAQSVANEIGQRFQS